MAQKKTDEIIGGKAQPKTVELSPLDKLIEAMRQSSTPQNFSLGDAAKAYGKTEPYRESNYTGKPTGLYGAAQSAERYKNDAERALEIYKNNPNPTTLAAARRAAEMYGGADYAKKAIAAANPNPATYGAAYKAGNEIGGAAGMLKNKQEEYNAWANSIRPSAITQRDLEEIDRQLADPKVSKTDKIRLLTERQILEEEYRYGYTGGEYYQSDAALREALNEETRAQNEYFTVQNDYHKGDRQQKLEEARQKWDAASDRVEALGGTPNRSNVTRFLKSWGENISGGVAAAAETVVNAGIGIANKIKENRTDGKVFGGSDKIDEVSFGSDLLAKGAEDRAMLTVGGTEARNTLVDIAMNAMDITADMLLNLALPGAGTARLAIGAFGAGANEAKERGAGETAQIIRGIVSAGTELITEGMFDGLAGVYGGGKADAMVDNLVGRIAGSSVAQNAWRLLFNSVGEGIEEVASDIGMGIADSIMFGDKLFGEGWNLQEMGYDFFIGSVMGFFGSGVDAATGGYKARNTISNFFREAKNEGYSYKNALQLYKKAVDVQTDAAEQFTDERSKRLIEITKKSGEEAGADARTVNAAAKLSAATGREVRFFNERAGAKAIKNGYEKDGVIYINARAVNPMAQVFSHELTHTLEGTEEYDVLMKTVKAELLKNGQDYELVTRNGIRELYQSAGIELTDPELDREVMAQFAEKYLFTDEEKIMQFVTDNRSGAQKVWDWIKSAVNRVTGKEKTFLQTAEGLYDKAFKAAAEQRRETPPARADENTVFAEDGAKFSLSPVADDYMEQTMRTAAQERSDNISPTENEDIRFSEELDAKQTAINQSMTMEQARRMIQSAYKIANIYNWYDGEYKTGDEWLRGEGAEAVALIVENDYNLQKKYVDSVYGIVNDEFSLEDVLAAYANGTLTGKEKAKPIRLDTSKSTGYEDTRFYAPRKATVNSSTLETAKQKVTKSNKETVIQARKDIIIAAHNGNAEADLGVSSSELNKMMRSWSTYPANAREVSRRINSGVAIENQWTGIQNCAAVNAYSISDEDIEKMCRQVEGQSTGNERRYIARTMLALDTHIDWSWLGFEFKKGRVRASDPNVRGEFSYYDKKIVVGGNGSANTVAHEMGHALDYLWWSELFGDGTFAQALSQNVHRADSITDPATRQFYENFRLFIDSLTNANDIRSEYTQRPTEVFARFVARFVEWADSTAGNKYYTESSSYNDRFTATQYIEFARLLQEKAALDSKKAVERTSHGENDTGSGQRAEEIARETENDGIRYSISPAADAEYMAAVESGDMATAQRLVYEAAKKAGYTAFGYRGTEQERRNEFRADAIYITENENVADSYKGKEKGTLYKLYANLGKSLVIDCKGKTDGSIYFPDEVFNRHPVRHMAEKYRSRGETTDFVEFAMENGYDSVTFKNIVDLGTANMDHYFTDRIEDITGTEYVVFDRSRVKSADPVTYDDNGNVIPLSERFKTENEDIRYSLSPAADDYAPTFYSKMERVIDDIKQPKLGAESVVSYLRGRGVKAEEIKWSGIEAFLEGKKSVTKEELQSFAAGSQIEIREIDSRRKDQEYQEYVSWVEDEGVRVRDDPNADEMSVVSNEVEALTLWKEDDGTWKGYLGEVEPNNEDDYLYFDEDEEAVEYVQEISARERYFWMNEGWERPTDHKENVRYEHYRMIGGDNYREILFQLPKSDYENRAMITHWGGKGIVAHARMQDMQTNSGKMMFVEEIQSDWNNALQKSKKEGKEGTVPDAPFVGTYTDFVIKRLVRLAAEEGYDSIGWTTGQQQEKRWSSDYAEGYRIEYDQDIPKFLNKYGKKWGGKVDKTTLENGETVWQFIIPESMKQSVLYEGQAKFSLSPATTNGTQTIPNGMSADEYMEQAMRTAAQERAERMRPKSRDEFKATPALEKIGVKVANSVGIYRIAPQLRAQNDAARKTVAKADREIAKLEASAAEKAWAQGVVEGTFNIAETPISMDRRKVGALVDWYRAKKSANTETLSKQRATINENLDEAMDDLFSDINNVKSPRMIVLNNRTPERNMRHIFGEELGGRINRVIFKPIQKNENERIRFVDRMYDEVRRFRDSKGNETELTENERALVHKVIEGKAAAQIVAGMEAKASEGIKKAAEDIRKGVSVGDAAKNYGLDENDKKLAAKYGGWLTTQEELKTADSVKIENAVKKYTEMFDSFYDAINDFLVAHGYEPIGFIKGYVPHMQSDAAQSGLASALKNLGLNTDVDQLPASIAGQTVNYKPNKRWNPYFLRRTGDMTNYDVATAYESYVDYMSDILYHTDDVMRLRAAERYFRRTYAPEEISNTISQAQNLRYAQVKDKREFLKDVGEIAAGEELSDARVNKMMEKYIEEQYSNIESTTKFGNLAMYLDNFANILAGKQSYADRGSEYSGGRKLLNLGNKTTRTFARSQVAGNLSSALNQAAQQPAIKAELGDKYYYWAIRDIIAGNTRKDGWAEESDFLTGKKGINYLVTNGTDKAMEILFTPAQAVDGLLSTIAVRGKYLKEIAAGKTHKEAMEAADDYGRSIMADRTKGSRPLAYEAKNPLSQMAHMFQIEAINTWEHITQDLPREFKQIEKEKGKTAAAAAVANLLVKYLVSAFLLNRLADDLYGGTPAPLDIVGLTMNFIASGNGLTTSEYWHTIIDNSFEKLGWNRAFGTARDKMKAEKFDWGAAAEDTWYNISNDLPFVRNISGMLGWGDNTLPIPDIAGKGKAVINAVKNDGFISMGNALAILEFAAEFMPGGRQISKTARGIEAVVRGGKYTGYGENERLKFPVDSAFEKVQAILFGTNAIEANEAFYAEDKKTLTVNETKAYQAAVEAGEDSKTMYDMLQKLKKVEKSDDESKAFKQRGLILDSKLTDAGKYYAYYYTQASEDERALMDELDGADMGKVAKTLIGIKDAEKAAGKRNVLMNSGLTGDQKLTVYISRLASDEEVELITSMPKADQGKLVNTLMGMKDVEKDAEKRAVISKSGLTGAEKMRLYEYTLPAGTDGEENKEVTLIHELKNADQEKVFKTLVELKDYTKNKDKLGVILKSGLTDSQKLAVYRNRISDERDEDIELFKKAGMDIDDFMTVQQKYAEVNDSTKNATEKELEFIRWVYSGKYSNKQREAIKETFAYYNMSRANADKYEALRSSKLSDDKASKVVKAVTSLKPTKGNADVKDWQKWDAICKLSLTDKEKSEALRAYMTEDQEKKYNIAEKYFVSADEYAEAQKLVAEKLAEKMKQSGSKSASITQDELEEILNSMGKSALFGIGLTSKQKAALWQLIGGWKTKNNPYDKETANAVYDELQKSKKSGTASGTDKASELRKALGIG